MIELVRKLTYTLDRDTVSRSRIPDGVIDLDAVRAQTRGAAEHVFLDTAGAPLMPTPVVDTVVAHLRREAEVGGIRAVNERGGRSDAAGGVSRPARPRPCVRDRANRWRVTRLKPLRRPLR
jgi:hypothetical protein